MLLTLIINSLNCTMLLIAIQTQKPGFESSRRWPRYAAIPPCTWGLCQYTFPTETLALGKSHKHLK